MPKRERVVCGPYLPGTAPTETTTEGGFDETQEEDEADITYPYDRHRFLPLPACPGRSKSSPCILFYRRKFPVYPEGAPTEAWDMLRLHLGHVVHQAAFDLNLPIYAIAAAVSAFHAVFPGHFTKEELCSSPHIVSRCMAACLFLAGKTSETNLKLREVVNCIDFLQWKLQQQHRLNTAASCTQEKQHESSKDSEKTGATDGFEEQKPPSSSSASSSSQQSKAQQQQGPKAEPRDDGGCESSAPSVTEKQEKKDKDTKGHLSDKSKKADAGVPDSGKKPTVKAGQPEEGFAHNKEGSSGNTAQSQSHRGESKSRICGIASFSRSSRYLKGYVPMGIREYWHVRQECLREEERLLQALGFSLPLPYLYDVLVEALVLLLPTHQEAHLIWAITNDIAATPLLEQFSPPILIAAAAVCAKKLLAVAASSPTVHHKAADYYISTTYTSRAVPYTFAGKKTPEDTPVATAAQGETTTILAAGSPRSDKLSWRNIHRNSGSNANIAKSSEMPSSNLLLLQCKTEPEEEVEREGEEVLGIQEPSTAPGKTPATRAEQARKAGNEASAGDAVAGKDTAAAINVGCDKGAYAANTAIEGMLEVLERLDPLLCGSPEYWALCKGHERRGLDRGGSRWARALPPAALGWAVFTPPNSAAAAGDSTEPNTTVDVVPATDRMYPSVECETSSPVSVQGSAKAKTDETTGAARDSYASTASDTEEHAERKRLLKEKQDDQRQRNIVYVQVAEACARLMEVYSLLLKSQRAPSGGSPPAT